MAIKSGRVGVRTDQVDVYGRVKGSAQMVLDDIANEYKSDVLYDVGAYVTYDSNLYRCLVANTRALPTDPIYWERVKIGDVLSEQSDEIVELKNGGIKYETYSFTASDTGILITNIKGKLPSGSVVIGVFITKTEVSQTQGYALYNEGSDSISVQDVLIGKKYKLNILYV